ncbi:hypothetical protein HO133_005941 [Letharia lupina]|uniref:Uncharacterized protein n=1 Tax=Letharia lupina TaxID=560253 RepID=A0A8H6C826_9LECA|nr:uncharacterized protein HO133_005941 [Letharia lupina]KAF6218590.1 hypothetical protein HO133_005941 [Letharia lupina]
MDSRPYLQDPRLSADSKRKCRLYDTASKRPGNKDPFLARWKGISDAQTRLALEMHAAVSKFKSLEAQLDGSVSKFEERKEQYDVVVDATSRWALEQQEVLAMDRVNTFVAEEEALIAAGTA